MPLFPKNWRPNKNNPDLEIIEREFAGRIAELREKHQAELAALSAKIEDVREEAMIQRGIYQPKLAAARAELAELQSFIAAWPARQAAMADELAEARATATARAHEMLAAAGIEIPTNKTDES